jgi:hypothetical protein
MLIKIAFLSGAYRIVETDCYTTDERFLVLVKDGQPILTVALSNVNFFETVSEFACQSESRQQKAHG